MDAKLTTGWIKFLTAIGKWVIDMGWFLKNISRARAAAEGATTKAPFCPRHEARMEFQNEEKYVRENRTHVDGEFKRNYKCPLCDYSTYNIFTTKRV